MDRGRLPTLLATLAFAGTTANASAPATREGVRALLLSSDAAISAERWRRLGDNVEVHLVDASRDDNLSLAVRRRAVEALGEIGSSKAQRFLRLLVEEGRAGPEIRAAGVAALASIRGANLRPAAARP